jgi:pimeloyl-ACP methyl ester carboxylesterase
MMLYADTRHGTGDAATLLLLHGLGANGAVWNPVLDALAGRWPGRIVVPDLRGHGRSDTAPAYALGGHAADVAALLGPGQRVAIVGHSMGGAVGIALAGGLFGVDVRSVLALGVKPVFTADEIEKARLFAAKPGRTFTTRGEAAERFLLATGLNGIVSIDDNVVRYGIRKKGAGYTLAADPKTVLVAGPPLAPMLRAALAPVRLATGEHDTVATADDLRACAGNVTVIAGAGHNVHVECPDVVAALSLDVLHAGSAR